MEFSGTLTLSQLGVGRLCPTIGVASPKFFRDYAPELNMIISLEEFIRTPGIVYYTKKLCNYFTSYWGNDLWIYFYFFTHVEIFKMYKLSTDLINKTWQTTLWGENKLLQQSLHRNNNLMNATFHSVGKQVWNRVCLEST